MNGIHKIIWVLTIVNLTAALFSCSQPSQPSQSEVEVPVEKIPAFEIVYPEGTGRFEKIHTKTPNLICAGDTVHNWILQGIDDKGSYVYYVTYHRLSEKQSATFNNNAIEKANFYLGSLTTASTKMGGENLSFNKVKIRKVEGLEARCNVFNGEGILITRCFIKDEHVFALGAGGEQVASNKVMAFLNSFDTRFQ